MTVESWAGLVATPLTPSHYLELLSPLWSTRRLSARVVALRDETPDVRTITLRPGRLWRPHRAGQHVRVSVVLDGRRATRTYSISSSPLRDDGCITITVKLQPGGRVSPLLVRRLRVGEIVSLEGPAGDFVLPDVCERPLFITAGSGITPVMSMLWSFALRRAMPGVAHLHYAPRVPDVIFRDEMAYLAAAHPRQYRPRILRTREPNAGRFDVRTLDSLVPDWRTREVWACGPRSLLDAVAAVVDPARLHIERFTAPRAAISDARGGRVHLRASGVEVDADGATPLLHVAERAGVSAPHGCRMGVCHTCDATMLSGCVRDLRTGERIAEPGARIQPCVCAAAGDVEIEL